MTSAITRLSNQGQINIPQEIRDQFHWETGQELLIESTLDGVLLRSKPAQKNLWLEDLRGFFKYDGPPIPIEELCKPVEMEADWDAAGQRDR